MTKNRNTEELKALKNDIDSLMAVMDCGILDLPHADQYLDMVFKKKEHYVLMVHNTKIQKQKGVRKNGKEYVIFAARPNGEKNYIKCAAYEGLIEKLYMYYTDCLADRSLKTLYSEAKRWKASNNIEISTLRRYQTTWEKFIEPYEISGKDIRKITAEDWTEHYETIIRKFSLTKKQVNNVRDVVSMITAYAQKKKIISHNTAKDVLYEDLPYKQTAAYNSVKVKPFMRLCTSHYVMHVYKQ